ERSGRASCCRLAQGRRRNGTDAVPRREAHLHAQLPGLGEFATSAGDAEGVHQATRVTREARRETGPRPAPHVPAPRPLPHVPCPTPHAPTSWTGLTRPSTPAPACADGRVKARP